MKRKLRTSFLATTTLLFGISTCCFASGSEIPELVDINLQSSSPALSSNTKDIKNVPNFSHAKHAVTFLKNNNSFSSKAYDNQFTCTACHEGVKENKDVLSEVTKENQAKAVGEAGGIKKYMHGVCLKCHKSMKKAKLTTGPTSCKGCHKPS